MPDIDVTIATTPIEVTVNTDPTVLVSVEGLGIQGPIGPSGDASVLSGDFVYRNETGAFYAASNPNRYAPSSFSMGSAIPTETGANPSWYLRVTTGVRELWLWDTSSWSVQFNLV